MKSLNNRHGGYDQLVADSIDSAAAGSDVAVIGGGLAGLAAATYLARSGVKVTLFEKSAEVGGRAASQKRAGAIFNLGAHALYSKSAAVEVLRELGVAYTGGSPVGIRCINGGENYLAPVDPMSLLRTGLFSKREKWQTARLLVKLQLSNPQHLASITVDEWVSKEVKQSKVRNVLITSARIGTYTNSPGQLSLGHFVEQLQLLAKGKVVYVDGGWQTLVDRLEQKATEAGAKIIKGARVVTVERDSNGVTGVRLGDGTLHSTNAVVMAVAPREALYMVERGENAALRGWAEGAVPLRAACLDVALRRLPEPGNKVVMDLERPLFLTTQSEFSNVTTGGGALLYALKYLDPSAPHDADADKRELEGWLDETQPGWRTEVTEQRFLPQLIVSNALVKASNGGNEGRPRPGVPGIANLYVAGDWVGPRGMLASASLWSAKLASEAILASRAVRRVPLESRAA